METYFGRLKTGEIAVISPYGQTRVGDVARALEDGAILILGEHPRDAIKPWSLARVTHEDGVFVHESPGTFF